jgi:hypothetical protein
MNGEQKDFARQRSNFFLINHARSDLNDENDENINAKRQHPALDFFMCDYSDGGARRLRSGLARCARPTGSISQPQRPDVRC